MATWTFKNVNPRMDGDRFAVDVEFYRDGVLKLTETFETTQDQPDHWPAELAQAMVQRKEGVTALAARITAGDIVLPAAPIVDAAQAAWFRDLSKLERATIVLNAGAIQPTNPKYVALQARVRTNFKPEYFDLL